MKITEIILLVIGIAYGAITVFAGSIGFRKKDINIWSSILMIVGGVLIAATVVINFIIKKNMIYILVIGLIFIQASAINNGLKMYGKINPKHHIIRLIISIIIVTLCIIS